MKKNFFIVLLYHGVDSGETFYAEMDLHSREYILSKVLFEKHIEYLHKNNYNILLLDECLSHMDSGTMPEKAVVLTFDDGEESCFKTIAPILDRYDFKGEFFIISDLIGKKNYINADNIKDLSRRKHSIQSHSMSHPFMKKIENRQIYEELKTSKHKISTMIGKEVKFFSIPTGFYDKRVLDTARKIGYKALLHSIEGYNKVSGDSFLLKRFVMHSYTDIKALKSICENKRSTLCRLLVKKIFTETLKFIITFNSYNRLRNHIFIKRIAKINKQ